MRSPARFRQGIYPRLQRSLKLTPGPLNATLSKTSSEADRAAAGLWRRDASAWSTDVDDDVLTAFLTARARA